MPQSLNSVDLPRISIGITTFDRTDLLIQSVKSALSQTYANLEIIIGNDNPARKLSLESLGLADDLRVHIENHSKNLGEIANLNWLLKESQGEFFTWLADDDLMHHQHIELLWKQLSMGENLAAAYSGYTSNIDEFSDYKNTNVPESRFHEYNFNQFLALYSGRIINLIGCYGLYNRDALIEMGGFSHLGKGFSPYSDTLIPILMSKKSNISYTPATTIFFRSHSLSMSNSLTDLDAYLSAEFDFLDRIRDSVITETLEYQLDIYEGFYYWFRENHLTVILRSVTPIHIALASWLRACAFNHRNFSRFGFKFRRNISNGLVQILKHQVRSVVVKT
jgi:glycosyltransferase involved in cell wall biosynthesis